MPREAKGERIRITYVPRPNVMSESEADTLAAVYRFIVGGYEKKNKAVEDEGGTHDST